MYLEEVGCEHFQLVLFPSFRPAGLLFSYNSLYLLTSLQLIATMFLRSFSLLAMSVAAGQAALEWQNVRTGASGGFTTGIIFHPSSEGIAYARTDIGGLYRLDATDDSWIPITDSLATDEGW